MRFYRLVLILIVCVLGTNVLTACGSPQVEAMTSESVTADNISGSAYIILAVEIASQPDDQPSFNFNEPGDLIAYRWLEMV